MVDFNLNLVCLVSLHSTNAISNQRGTPREDSVNGRDKYWVLSVCCLDHLFLSILFCFNWIEMFNKFGRFDDGIDDKLARQACQTSLTDKLDIVLSELSDTWTPSLGNLSQRVLDRLFISARRDSLQTQFDWNQAIDVLLWNQRLPSVVVYQAIFLAERISQDNREIFVDRLEEKKLAVIRTKFKNNLVGLQGIFQVADLEWHVEFRVAVNF